MMAATTGFVPGDKRIFGGHKVVMREDHGYLPINLDIAAILKFLDGVCTVEWASQVPETGKKDVI